MEGKLEEDKLEEVKHEQGHKVWDGLDHSLTSNLLDKITNIIECAICSEIMIIPVTAECGHSFCYGCIYQWFGTKLNCPTCRKVIDHKPILNIQLKEISKGMVDLLIDTDSKDKLHLIGIRDESIKSFENDKSCKQIFGNLFKGAVMLIDNSDGVPRCGNCHWEAHGNVCNHCGTRFRNARNMVDGDFDGDDDEEDLFQDVDSENDYDFEDGFIDGRTVQAIERLVETYGSDLDLYEDPDEDLSPSANDNWFGFETDDSSSFELNGEDEEDDLSPSVIEAMHELHNDDGSGSEEYYDEHEDRQEFVEEHEDGEDVHGDNDGDGGYSEDHNEDYYDSGPGDYHGDSGQEYYDGDNGYDDGDNGYDDGGYDDGGYDDQESW
ncbi:RING finger protein PSH1 [Spathaspora sp. JA1]|nr:RING finger protein PSH1 [Spathaspora sp. JA1]